MRPLFRAAKHFYLASIAYTIILRTKINAAQNEAAFSYHRLRGLYFLAVVFVATITAGVAIM